MPRGINPARLESVIQELQKERADLQRRIDEIDAIFTRCGISPNAVAVRRWGRRPAIAAGAVRATAGKRGRRGRGRRRFGKSAAQSILDFVKSAGREGASSAEIARHWKQEGRAGEPYVALGALVKEGKLKKKDLQGRRGSQYTVA